MRPLRFCHITTFYPPYAFGGDGVFVQQLAHLLADQGHEVEVVCCLDSYRLLRGRVSQPMAHLPHPGVKLHTLDSGWGALSPVFTHLTGLPLFKSAALDQILSAGFDVIHYHNLSLIGLPVTSMGNALKLQTSHEYWLHCPTHLLLKWGRDPCRSKNCWACSLAQKRPPQLWRSTPLLRQALGRLDLCLCPTNFARELHLEAGFPTPVEVLPNFVVDRGPPERVQAGQGFLYVGRLEWVKGVLDLVDLFANLPQHQLTLIGDGPLRRQILARAGANVKVLGYQSQQSLVSHYRAARAVLVPSRSHELGPLVMMEAMAQSTPVVVSPMGDMAGIARAGCGRVAATPQEWRAAIEELAGDQNGALEMGRQARRYYESHFTPRVHLDRYLGLVESRLSSSRSSKSR